MDESPPLALGLDVQAARTRWAAVSLRDAYVMRGEAASAEAAVDAARRCGMIACIGVVGEGFTATGDTTHVMDEGTLSPALSQGERGPDVAAPHVAHVPGAGAAAWLAAAGIAEPSTLVVIAEGGDAVRWAMNSRVVAAAAPPVLQLPEGLLPCYVGYVGEAATPLQLTGHVAALRDAGVPVRRFVLTGEPPCATADAARALAAALDERVLCRPVADGLALGAAIRAAVDLPADVHGHATMSQLIHALAGPRRSGTLFRPARKASTREAA